MIARLMIVLFAVSLTQCVIARRSGAGPGSSAKACPPGHRWSDGQCHGRGKGHDPNKKRGKSKGKKKGKKKDKWD